MPTAISIDGALIDPDQAAVPVMDRGFLYGDSAFEVTRTYGGQPFELGAHLARLAWSCERIGIPPLESSVLRADVLAALAAAGNDESYVRVIVTRGVTAIGLGTGGEVRPRRVVVALPLTPQPRELYERGVEVRTVTMARALDGSGAAGAKASNYLPNILALESARAHGAYEAISLGAGGEVLEGSTSNLFVVTGGRVRTPRLSLGILSGITRGVVMRAAAEEGIPLEEALLFPPDLYRAEEAFITSSLREMIPVVRADGVAIGDGTPGALTARLFAAFGRVRDALLAAER